MNNIKEVKICFASSPYRAKHKSAVSENIRHAKELSRKLAEQGYVVISPLCNFSFSNHTISEGDILKACLALVARSDMVCMGIGWRDSQGCLAEYFEAVDKKKEIIYECDGL